MRPSQALNLHREEIRKIVNMNRARNARGFGSVLYGSDAEGSDLDVLVEPLPGATLFDMGAIQIALQERLGVAVHVLTPGDVPTTFRDQVLKEATPV